MVTKERYECIFKAISLNYSVACIRKSHNKVGVEVMLVEGLYYRQIGEGRRNERKILGKVLPGTEKMLWLSSWPSIDELKESERVKVQLCYGGL